MEHGKDFLKHKKSERSKHYLSKVSRWMLVNILLKEKDGFISVQEIVNLISVGAFYFVLLVFAFPVALPLPYPPGFPSICGIPIFLLSLQMLFNRKYIILPRFIMEYKIKVELIKLIMLKSNKILKVISKVIRANRMDFLANMKLMPLYGFLFIIFSICILIPLPLTNFLPAVGIFICCLGLLFSDGLLILIGLVIGFIGVVSTYLVTALFGHIFTKFFKFTYEKISNIYFNEGLLSFALGVFVGMASVLIAMIFYKMIKSKIQK